MKTFIRHVIFYALALYLTTQIISGLDITPGLDTLLIGAIILAGFQVILEPVLNIFLLPLNVITFGLSSSLTTVVAVFLLTKLFYKVSIHPFQFGGLGFFGIEVKPFFAGIFLSYLIISVIIFAIVKFLKWISGE